MPSVYVSDNLENTEVQEDLQDTMSPGYYANAYGFSDTIIKNMPLFTLWTSRQMLSDPTVRFALVIRNAAVSAARISVTSPKEEVRQFVENQWHQIWGRHQTKLMRTKETGYGAYEMLYKEEKSSGRLVVEGVKEFAPQDVRAIRLYGKPAGFRLHNRNLVRSDPRREHSVRYIKFPRGLWLSYDSRYESMYGRSVMRNAYAPWFEKWMNHGAKKSQQMRMIKDAYPQLVGWYDQNEKIRLPDNTIVTAQNVMRSLLANLHTAGVMTLPSNMNDQNHRKWDVTRLPDAGDPSRMFRWTDELNEDIYRGMSVPSEIISAASSGSGYSGRSIPMAVFLQSCQQEFNEYMTAIDEQVIRPLVMLNFGDDDYEMEPMSLLMTFTQLMSEDMGGGAIDTGGDDTFSGSANYNPEAKLAAPGQIEKRGDASVLGDQKPVTVTTLDKQKKTKQMSEEDIEAAAEVLMPELVAELKRQLKILAGEYPPWDLRAHDAIAKLVGTYAEKISERLSALTFSAFIEGVLDSNDKIVKFLGDVGTLAADTPPNVSLAQAADIMPEGLEVSSRVLRELSTAPASAGVDYLDTAEKTREGIFAITGPYEEETVASVKSAMEQTVRQGGSPQEFADRVGQMFDDGQVPLSDNYLRMVYRTKFMSAYSDGLEAGLASHGHAFPYRKYRATEDERVRPEHLELQKSGLQDDNGKTAYYEADSEVWRAFRPPWDYNCRCAQTAITVREAARQGVKHAQTWWETAKALAEEHGGKPEFYLAHSRPAASGQVWPTLNGERIEPNLAFQRPV